VTGVLKTASEEVIVPESETVTREELEEVRDSLRDLRLLIISGGNGSAAAPAATVSSGPADAVQLLALEDLTDKITTLGRQIAKLPADLGDELEDRFLVEQYDDEQPAKGSSKPNSKTKTPKNSASDAELEEAQPRRRTYFPDADA
jgi:hypothetical protein